MAAIPGPVSKLLSGGSSIGESLLIWAVLGQIIGAVMGPISADMQQEVQKLLKSTPLTPEQCADLVIKGWMSVTEGENEAVLSGVTAERFKQLVHSAGEPISLQDLLFLWRRGNIDEARVDHGIRESRIRDEWIDAAKALRQVPVSPSDAVSAVVRGQIDHDAGAKLAWLSGINETDFDLLVHTTGNPPSPTELADFVRRGLIPMQGTGPDALSFQQGIFEGDAKDKWEPIYEHLIEYIPPPRTVTALEREGAITAEQAQALYQKSGLSAELAAAYSSGASGVRTAKAKELAESQVLTLYEAKAIDAGQAGAMLHALGYSDAEIVYILELHDLARELKAVETAVSKLHNFYVAGKIGVTSARGALGTLGLTGAQIDELLRLWTLERDANVRLLTHAEIVDAWDFGIMTQAEAQNALEALGYTPFDAWVLLSIKKKSPQGTAPPVGATITGQKP